MFNFNTNKEGLEHAKKTIAEIMEMEASDETLEDYEIEEDSDGWFFQCNYCKQKFTGYITK